ncbi:Hypothetical protein R9X50_00532300 [Acrodontium crateriforme]|uniref:Mediator of RNA polymerase II transcription subunit 13 n=1 Tax=Acrodontium crateriforme TaxID=150365 RepID=A0AAQ3R915_9PEZI|nr:Hypothetical protein R9X50_00532300 [Acrodontium crateriforme]
MDFFKSCRSNVLLVEGVSKTQFRAFSTVTASHRVDRTIQTLRDRGTLCAQASSQLWVFGISEGENDTVAKLKAVELEDEGIKEVYNGALGTESLQKTHDGRHVRDVLLDAIEGSISYRFAKESGATRIGLGLWHLSGGPDDTGFIIRLSLEFTENNSLYVTTSAEASPIINLKHASNLVGQTFILAPIGKTVQPVLNDYSYLESTSGPPTTESKRTTTVAMWRAAVTGLLASEGIDISDDEPWIPFRLESDRDSETVTWPSAAAFCLRDKAIPSNVLGRHDDVWRNWFTVPGEDDPFRNPLSTAEEWYTGAAEREKALREVTDMSEHPELHSGNPSMSYTTIDIDNALSTSPPFTQRNADQQSAIGGIYPTPPDGLMLVSQPLNNIESVIASAHAGPVSLDSGMTRAPEDQAVDQTMESPNDPQAFASNNEDLFGDMDGMDFAGDEVGDADFNFFDEPDDDPASETRQNNEMMDIVEDEEKAAAVTHQDSADNHQPNHDMNTKEDTNLDLKLMDTHQEPEITESPPLKNDELETRHSDPPLLAAEDQLGANEPEKPLSPFGVKERLLPPPIPASARQSLSGSPSNNRRSSKFDPVAFRESIDLGQKYAPPAHRALVEHMETQGELNISLPTKHKKPRIKRPLDSDSDASDRGDESEEDSYESASSMSDENMPPKLPWDTKKRKRSTDQDTLTAERAWNDQTMDDGSEDSLQEQGLIHLLRSTASHCTMTGETDKAANLAFIVDMKKPHIENGCLPPTDTLLQLSPLDLVYTAQLVNEQAVTCTSLLVEQLGLLTIDFSNYWPISALASQRTLEQLVQYFLPATLPCTISELALIREPHRQVPPPAARPGQPRPPQRIDSVNLGPDFHLIPPPYVRVQRGQDTFEMLPPSLDFWETLSLGPSSGAKDVRAFCVYPSSDELRGIVDVFLGELGSAYENCKLGSHVHVRNMIEDIDLDDYEDGLVPVDLSEDDNLETTLRAYSSICADLGAFMSEIAHVESERTFVVYMINPFTHAKASHHLCACFWLLYEAYRSKITKMKDGQSRSDVVLQLLPIELIAAYEAPVILDARQMGMLAKETYDRCPPSALDSVSMKAVSLGFAAPFVELATAPPRRINFQLTADPPSDLMHEPSLLHLAYALSKDKEWIVATWADNAGRNQSSLSLSTRGKSFADVAEDIWTRTKEVMSEREVTWRVFILTAEAAEASIHQCWRKIITQPRKHLIHVTFLTIDLFPSLKLLPPQPNMDDAPAGGVPGTSVLTPASTPQGTPFTFSPDASSHTAPPTPAPTDVSANAVDNDPDAHLIDFADETWAVLFSPTYARAQKYSAFANGALFKRGEPDIDHFSLASYAKSLPSLIVGLHWTIQVRPNANVDEGNVKQAEATLREALRMYRNLSVLTRARGLGCPKDGKVDWNVMPVHLVAALRGVEGLDGLLS